MERSQSCRSKTRLRAGLCLLCLCGLLWACVPASRTPTAPLPRANPGYVQWLERQSMLAASPQYTRLVSGTEILFRLPAADTGAGRIDALLEAAGTWLFVYPPSLLTEGQRSVMAELHTGPSLHQLKLLGIGGVYMAPTAESAALWTGQSDTPSPDPAKDTSPTDTASATAAQSDLWGEEATSLTFAPHVGTESQFTDLARSAGREQLQLGAGLVPAAIGIGPDFLLATRHVRDYPGSVMMVDVPKEYWHLLPPTPALARPQTVASAAPKTASPKSTALSPTSATLSASAPPASPSPAQVHNEESPYTNRAWAAIALNGPYQVALDALVAKNIVPLALVRDNLPWASHSGWAATPIMEGIDGVERRFVYRYYGSVNRPVLQWDDPSRNAQRILSASTIRTIGSQQQTLGGLYPEAWAGLDIAHSPTPATTSANTNIAYAQTLPEPAAAALRDLSREIRRYGGWSMQADVFPPSLSPSILATGVDFTLDTITSPTAEYALLTGDTQPLKEALKASLAAGVDHKRLVHSLPHYKGLDLRPLYDSNHGRSAATKLQAWLNTAPAKAWLGSPTGSQAQHINATAATLAAMAAGYSPSDATRPEHAASIQARHMLLTSLRAGMPGLLMLSGADLSGALNVAANTLPAGSGGAPTSPLGGWGFSAMAQAGVSTRTGLARAPSVYGPMQAQAAQPDSYTQQLSALLAQRQQWGLARAQLMALPDTSYPSTVALLLQLPDKSYALTVANFSDTARSETIRIATAKTDEARATEHKGNMGNKRDKGNKGGKGATGEGHLEAGSPRVTAPIAKHEMRLELDPWQCRLIHIP